MVSHTSQKAYPKPKKYIIFFLAFIILVDVEIEMMEERERERGWVEREGGLYVALWEADVFQILALFINIKDKNIYSDFDKEFDSLSPHRKKHNCKTFHLFKLGIKGALFSREGQA